MKKSITFNSVAQVCLVLFTTLGFLLTALKLPQYGLISNLIGEIFWLYSSYKAWKNADQIGMFINSIIISIILIGGVINYWLIVR
jgi:hypothetical protein